MESPTSSAERYRAVQSRDRRFDGQFFTAVKTTGIYCRPSCPAMTPKATNVLFFSTSAAAHEAGFRACKRCLPEASPGSPEWNLRQDLAGRAMRIIREGALNDGDVDPKGAIGVIAPGTGLGEAYLTWDGQRYHAYASEGGHADFGPTDALEIGLLRYMLQRHDHVSYEKVCSGLGIANLYAYLKDMGYAPEPPWLIERLIAAQDPTPVIVKAALEHEEQPCELAVATLRLFVSILGAEAGNLALKLMCSGGVYLGGGIPRRVLPWLEHKNFMQAFLNKGRFSGVLIRFPVHVILNSNAALLGVACYGLGQ